jgi:hypothetical protein
MNSLLFTVLIFLRSSVISTKLSKRILRWKIGLPEYAIDI